MVSKLPAHKLRIETNQKQIPWDSSSDIPIARSNIKHMLQPRVAKAMELAIKIQKTGYNIYLSGNKHLGRSYIVQEFLQTHTRESQAPPDIIYAYNFSDKDKPIVIRLPAGHGQILKKTLQDILVEIRNDLLMQFEDSFYIESRTKILETYQKEKSSLLKEMNCLAKLEQFSLDVDDAGSVNLFPMLDDKKLAEEEFDSLELEVRQEYKQRADTLMNVLGSSLRQLGRLESDTRSNEKDLERKVAEITLKKSLQPIQESCQSKYSCAALNNYLEAFYEDILNSLDTFMTRDAAISSNTSPPSLQNATGGFGLDFCNTSNIESELSRYSLNIFVDNSQSKGAPIVFEEHPTAINVLGCIERESETGSLVTDFKLIKAGSLHKADGGYLIIRVEDILQHFQAWEGLLRTLRTGLARIEDISENADSSPRTKGLEPEPIALNVKVILIGSENLYETLLQGDERFGKLFKIKAHLCEQTERNAQNIKYYLHRLANIINDAQLLPFDKSALAWMVDYGSSIIEDQQSLSLKFPLLHEIMLEASCLAKLNNDSSVTAQTLEKALEEKTYRANLVEEHFMEDYDRGLIKVRTSGQAIGQVNGLSITWHGDFEFGLPHQISCVVGVGHGGIIDLERESELGGPIHTKAMMILKSYLVSLFARQRPIILTGSLCIEQSYAGIEGDSASGAELVALLSAIAEVPVRLDLAFTGALSQSGQIMAVGGVNRKIEGFFNVCARHGLTGTQGVLIPYDNVEHLMLSPRIMQAVLQEQFSVYPIKHIDEALELLTGLKVGKRRQDNSFTPNSLYSLVDERLRNLGACAAKDIKAHRKNKGLSS